MLLLSAKACFLEIVKNYSLLHICSFFHIQRYILIFYSLFWFTLFFQFLHLWSTFLCYKACKKSILVTLIFRSTEEQSSKQKKPISDFWTTVCLKLALCNVRLLEILKSLRHHYLHCDDLIPIFKDPFINNIFWRTWQILE